jgi:hypothetical protein
MASLGEISGDSGKQRERLIAVYIAILAVALSICSVGGGNATKDATARNIEASNAWAFFQAKNIRRNDVRIEINELELRLATDPTLSEAAKAAIEERLKQYREQEAHLTSEPETGEGVQELMARGKALQAQRDIAMRKDPYFDYGQALLQIAIVLASVSIITGGSVLLLVSGVLAAGGLLSMLNGFFLLVG